MVLAAAAARHFPSPPPRHPNGAHRPWHWPPRYAVAADGPSERWRQGGGTLYLRTPRSSSASAQGGTHSPVAAARVSTSAAAATRRVGDFSGGEGGDGGGSGPLV